MSRENVVLFTNAATEKSDLNARLAETEKLADWLKIATEEGFEFTAEEFCSVVEETLQKKVTPQDAVREYLAAGREMGQGELSEGVLDAVVGGKKTRHIVFVPQFLQSNPKYIGDYLK